MLIAREGGQELRLSGMGLYGDGRRIAKLTCRDIGGAEPQAPSRGPRRKPDLAEAGSNA